MNLSIQTIRKKIPLNLRGYLRYYKNKLFNKIYLRQWVKAGCPVPPPHIIKQAIIKKYANEYKIKVLVETGTYLGDMIFALKNNFDLIYSIELGHDLWLNAVKRFKHYKHITILEGDSGKELFNLVPLINHPCIFWLDGHYSGGITAMTDKQCPIYAELEAVFNSKVKGNIILIDDARLFNGQDDYPKIEDLNTYIKNFQNNALITIEHDLIRIIL